MPEKDDDNSGVGRQDSIIRSFTKPLQSHVSLTTDRQTTDG